MTLSPSRERVQPRCAVRKLASSVMLSRAVALLQEDGSPSSPGDAFRAALGDVAGAGVDDVSNARYLRFSGKSKTPASMTA